MIEIPHGVRSLVRDGKRHVQAHAWKLTPRYAQAEADVIRLTDWPEQILVRESAVGRPKEYTPVGAPQASARRRSAEIRTNNQELQGVVSSRITYAQLSAGWWDGATIDEFLVDVRTPWMGFIDYNRWYVREVSHDEFEFAFALDTIEGILEEPLGGITSRDCNVEVYSQGDGMCNVDPALHNVDGIVSELTISVPTRTTIRAELDSAPTVFTSVDDYLEGAFVVWTSGANIGQTSRVRRSTLIPSSDDVLLDFFSPTFFLPERGDTFTFRRGCNKLAGSEDLVGDCKNYFDNLLNFRGYDRIPGADKAQQGLA